MGFPHYYEVKAEVYNLGSSILAFHSQQLNWKPWCWRPLARTALWREVWVQRAVSSLTQYRNSLRWRKWKPNPNYLRTGNEHTVLICTLYKTTLFHLYISQWERLWDRKIFNLCFILANLWSNSGNCKHHFRGVNDALIWNWCSPGLDLYLFLPFSILFYIFLRVGGHFFPKKFTAIANNCGLFLLKDTWILDVRVNLATQSHRYFWISSIFHTCIWLSCSD